MGVDCAVGGEAVEAEDAECGGHFHGGMCVYSVIKETDLGELVG